MQLFVSSIAGYIVLVFIRSTFLQLVILTSTNKMHNTMAEKVIRATILFFDSNPLGRISTRFQKDIMVMDSIIAQIASVVIQGGLRALTVIIMVSITSPYILVVALPGMIYMRYLYNTGIGPII